MSALVWIGLGALGGLGAVGRFALDGAVTVRAGSAFPLGTLAVNISGSFVLGVIAGAVSDADALHLFATGLTGGFSTFSTWMFENHRLAEDGEFAQAWANVAVSALLGLAALWAGMTFGEGL